MILGDPRAQVLGLEPLSLRTPKHLPKTPDTILQWKIEKSLGNQFQEQMGAFQWSMLDVSIKVASTVSKPTPDPPPRKEVKPEHILSQAQAEVQNKAYQDPGISKFQVVMNLWTQPGGA